MGLKKWSPKRLGEVRGKHARKTCWWVALAKNTSKKCRNIYTKCTGFSQSLWTYSSRISQKLSFKDYSKIVFCLHTQITLYYSRSKQPLKQLYGQICIYSFTNVHKYFLVVPFISEEGSMLFENTEISRQISEVLDWPHVIPLDLLNKIKTKNIFLKFTVLLIGYVLLDFSYLIW